ncbi:MAG: hypothetical protein RL271_671, partial [Actinomycetota bacterium]
NPTPENLLDLTGHFPTLSEVSARDVSEGKGYLRRAI